MKKQMTMLLVAMIVFNSIGVYAAENITILINDSLVISEVDPFIEDGTTYVPLRVISENLGAEVNWIAETKTVEIIKEGIDKIVIDKPNIVDGRTFVPLRFVAENLNCTVDWDNDNKIVTITSKDYVEKEEVLNTIDSLGLERHKIADYPVLSKSDFKYQYYNREEREVYEKTDVVFVTEKDLPFQFGDRMIYSFDINGDTLKIKQKWLDGTEPIWIDLAVTNEGIRRARNADYKYPTIDLGNGKVLATYDEVALSDSLKFKDYESFKWEQVEYFIFQSDEIPELIAFENPVK